MPLSEGDKNTCRELAREIIREVMTEHIASCPHGRLVRASKFLLIGLLIGSGAISGGLVMTLAKLLGS